MTVHEGDLVTSRGRDGVWRVVWVRHGAARLAAVDGTGGVTATTVALEDLALVEADEGA